jgi:hypothetical protein
MDTKEIQQRLFKQIAEKQGKKGDIVKKLEEILGKGSDSAYRRMSGKQELSMSELIQLCQNYDISMDALAGSRASNVIFKHHASDMESFDLLSFYEHYEKEMSESSKKKQKQLIYVATDIPKLHFLPWYELMMFKVYLFHRTFCSELFSFEDYLSKIQPNRAKLVNYSNSIRYHLSRIPIVEVWTDSTIQSFLKLIGLNIDLGLVREKQRQRLLYEQLISLLGEMREWSENGKIGDSDYSLYLSEVDTGISYNILKLNDKNVITIRLFTNINGLHTSDGAFVAEAERNTQYIIKNAKLISGTAALERNRFFNNMHHHIKIEMDSRVL